MTTARPTYRQLLGSRGVPGLFGVSLANVLGTSLQILALSVLVYAQTGSALWSGAIFAAGFLPQLVGGALLTSLADRWPTRTVLAAGATVRAAGAVALALGGLSPGWSLLLVGVVAVVQPVPGAAQSALVARLLAGELYVLGRSVFNLISSGAQLLGLAAGGAVVAGLGPHAALGVAAGVQIAGLLTVATLPATRPAGGATLGRWHPGETWRADRELLQDRVVRRILLSWWLPLTLLVGAESLVVAYVGEQGGSAAATGWLYAAFPAGAAVGDLLVGRWWPENRRRRAVPWLMALVGAGMLPLATHPPVAVAVLTLAAASAGTAYQLGGQQTFVAAVPASRHAVGFGLAATGTMTGQGVGPLVAGVLADRVGAGVTVTVLGVVTLALTLVIGRLPTREADRSDTATALPAGPA